MTLNTVVGLGVFAGALAVTIFLTLWCRRIIELVHAKKPKTLRELQQELKDG